MTNFGLLIFEEAEELDFCGPWEVFTASSMLRDYSDQVMIIAEHPGPVRCGKGMRVLPDRTLEDTPPLDLLLVPGGYGTRKEVFNSKLISWIAKTSATVTWVTSVCTGALLLHEAGISRGRRVATHFNFVEQLRARGANVLTNVRYVEDGNLISAAGVSAGIDMSLWLVGQLVDPKFARKVQRWIEYDPKPPYADVQI